MNHLEVQIIKGGWKNVPPNLKCRSDLKKQGLVPRNQNHYTALVWNSYEWIKLYDINNCRPKRQPSPKQLIALENGRKKLREMLTCSQCDQYVYFKQNLIGDICITRNQINKWEEKQQYLKEKYESMVDEGKSLFTEWYNKDILILDTETTGLYDDEIIELAIIDKHGNVLFNSLFNPQYAIPTDVTEIHGIDKDLVADAPKWKDKWEEIKKILEGKLVIIFNNDFDISMIKNTNRIWEIEEDLKITSGCAMEAYRLYIGSDRWINLSQASGTYTAHRAVDDCISVLVLLNRIWTELNLIND